MPAGYGRNIGGSGGAAARPRSKPSGPRNPAPTSQPERTGGQNFWNSVLKNRLRRNKKVSRGLIGAAGPDTLKRIATTRGLYR